jgi:hypothetical protein
MIHVTMPCCGRSKSFQGVMRDISGMLKETYAAESAIVIPGSGTYGMWVHILCGVTRPRIVNDRLMVPRLCRSPLLNMLVLYGRPFQRLMGAYCVSREATARQFATGKDVLVIRNGYGHGPDGVMMMTLMMMMRMMMMMMMKVMTLAG